jgi:RNA polymerase sigma factor (sigma-70 family)
VGSNVVVAAAGRGETLTGRLIRRGADRDFEEFFDVVWPRALLMASRMGLRREEAEDVVLDAMAITYDRWGRVKDLPYREAWVLKVTANRVLRQLKRIGRDPAHTTMPASRFEDDLVIQLSLRKSIAGLPRRQRQVVALRYLADMPEVQVAQVLGLDVGSVKRHANRGRARLRNTLRVFDDGDNHG